MAKKKPEEVTTPEATTEEGTVGVDGEKFYEAGGRGKKGCPKCGKYVGARLNGKRCPNPDCTYEFPAKETEPKEGKTKQKELTFGETLDKLKKVKVYAKEAGGVKKLLEQIESLEEIAMQVDGLEGLKEALKALDEF